MGDQDYEKLCERLDKLEHRLTATSEYVLVGWLLGASAIILYLGRLLGLAGTVAAAVILAVLWWYGLRKLRHNLRK